ncbi:SAG-related sequence [Besnoitia besnoiti]|uniref:SAG-related sequence n=1 Tax=Besnoitia besnoiti TaxID=94643 RepID=A0A2A9MLV8_BESBE|nr:SAG-related sequence [Besnoitia besnoiti]PFH37046.1 SAG-related sequence [Besnoitia besnoiti]
MQASLSSGACKSKNVMIFCLAGILLLSSREVFASPSHEESTSQSESVQDVKDFPGEVVTCPTPGDSETQQTQTVALSKKTPATTLHCVGEENKKVPEDPSEVCIVHEDSDKEECKSIKLQTLFNVNSDVQWIRRTPADDTSKEAWSLQLIDSNLPLTDTNFFVRCQSGVQNKFCQMNVSVTARPSSVDNNVVTCGYGLDSNPHTLKTEMTKENNTLTIACGIIGSINPASYETTYCEDEQMTSCKKSYTDILSNYSQGWCKKDTADNSRAILTIPKTEFPSEELKFFMGCAPNGFSTGDSGSSSQQSGTNSSPAKSSCKRCRRITMSQKGGTERQTSGYKPKARKFLTVCVGGVLMLSGEAAHGHPLQEGRLLRSGDGHDAQNLGVVVHCPVSNSDAAAPDPVTLSSEALTTTLYCNGAGNTKVPSGATEVCAPQLETLATCTSGTKSTLQTLLGTSYSIEWKKMDPPPEDQGEAWMLKLSDPDLPFKDAKFFVGCQNSSRAPAECKVDITVKARRSSVADNAVSCAYGSDSNPNALNVEITQEKNTLTLTCGEDGVIKPATDEGHYCEDEKLEKCEKSFQDILPKFDNQWWTKKGQPPAAMKLTIPREDFPSEEQKFYIGCSPKSTDVEPKASVLEGDGAQAPSTGPTTCRVLVTVKAAGSVSKVSTFGQLFPLAGAAAALGHLSIFT